MLKLSSGFPRIEVQLHAPNHFEAPKLRVPNLRFKSPKLRVHVVTAGHSKVSCWKTMHCRELGLSLNRSQHFSAGKKATGAP